MAKSAPIPKSRQYKASTLKRLFALSGNVCAFPGCPERFVKDSEDDLMAQICHIEAAESGGQRYNVNQTDDERRSFENLLLLCPNHHIETNNVSKYPVDAMKKIKRDHEAKMLVAISVNGALTKYPVALVSVINQISSSDVLNGSAISNTGLHSFSIEKKIEYNNIQRYRSILDEFKIYQGKLNDIYEELEVAGGIKKELLLNNIKTLYLRAKDKLNNGSSEMDTIRQNADAIIEEVENGLWELIERSNNLDTAIPYEAIQSGLLIVLVDAFMRCKILEEPA